MNKASILEATKSIVILTSMNKASILEATKSIKQDTQWVSVDVNEEGVFVSAGDCPGVLGALAIGEAPEHPDPKMANKAAYTPESGTLLNWILPAAKKHGFETIDQLSAFACGWSGHKTQRKIDEAAFDLGVEARKAAGF